MNKNSIEILYIKMFVSLFVIFPLFAYAMKTIFHLQFSDAFLFFAGPAVSLVLFIVFFDRCVYFNKDIMYIVFYNIFTRNKYKNFLVKTKKSTSIFAQKCNTIFVQGRFYTKNISCMKYIIVDVKTFETLKNLKYGSFFYDTADMLIMLEDNDSLNKGSFSRISGIEIKVKDKETYANLKIRFL